MTGASALRLELRPSRALAATILIAHLAAAASLLVVLPGLPGAALAVLAAALGAAAAHDRALLRSRLAPRVIHLRGDGEGSLESADGSRWPVAPGAGRVGRRWVILRLDRGRRRHLLVAGDMLEPDAFRRLRLWARWGRLPLAGRARRAA